MQAPWRWLSPEVTDGARALVTRGASGLVDELLPATVAEADRRSTVDRFAEIQSIIANDLPVLPLWQGKQYVAAHTDVMGAEYALNSSSALQLWELDNGVSGALEGPSAYPMKSPPKQIPDDDAHDLVETFIKKNPARTPKASAQQTTAYPSAPARPPPPHGGTATGGVG